MTTPRDNLTKLNNWEKELTKMLDDILASKEGSSEYYQLLLTDGKLDPVKVNKLGIECDQCVGEMDKANFSEQRIQEFLDLRNDAFFVLEMHLDRQNREEEYKKFGVTPTEGAREQVVKSSMQESVTNAITNSKVIKKALIENENEYRKKIKNFCRDMEKIENKMKSENPDAYAQLQVYMQPYKNIAELDAISETAPFEVSLQNIASEENLHNIQDAILQANEFFSFAREHKLGNLITDNAALPFQRLTRAAEYLKDLDKNLNNIDAESIERKTVVGYLETFQKKTGAINEMSALRDEEKKNQKINQEIAKFNEVKSAIVNQLNDIFVEKSRQKLGGDISDKVLTALLEINAIEVNGTKEDMKRGLEEIGKALNDIRGDKKGGLIQTSQSRKVVESVNKTLRQSEAFKSLDSKQFGKTINEDLKKKAGIKEKIMSVFQDARKLRK